MLKIIKKYGFFLSLLIAIIGIAIFFLFNPILFRNLVIPIITYHNYKNAAYDKEIVEWCDLPLSHDLDKGGVPFDYQDITHPSIVYVPDSGFAGNNWWIAATPYPQTLPTRGEPYENTCIFYANSKNAPTKFSAIGENPIIKKADAFYCSDPEIFYDSDLSVMYAFTRKHTKSGYDIFLQSSKDGENWSNAKCVLKNNTHSLCPVVLKHNGVVYLYLFEDSPGVQHPTSEMRIYTTSSLEEPNFKLKTIKKWDLCSNFWHGDIFEYSGTFFMVYCGTNSKFRYIYGSKDAQKYLWLAVSKDGINFKEYDKPIIALNGVYRSTLTIVNNKFICYFSTLARYVGHDYPAGNRIGKIEVPLTELLQKLK